jgi:hypothetical protein
MQIIKVILRIWFSNPIETPLFENSETLMGKNTEQKKATD